MSEFLDALGPSSRPDSLGPRERNAHVSLKQFLSPENVCFLVDSNLATFLLYFEGSKASMDALNSDNFP